MSMVTDPGFPFELIYRSLMENQAKLLAAFICETGLRPSECELVSQITDDGFKVYFRKKVDHDSGL